MSNWYIISVRDSNTLKTKDYNFRDRETAFEKYHDLVDQGKRCQIGQVDNVCGIAMNNIMQDNNMYNIDVGLVIPCFNMYTELIHAIIMTAPPILLSLVTQLYLLYAKEPANTAVDAATNDNES